MTLHELRAQHSAQHSTHHTPDTTTTPRHPSWPTLPGSPEPYFLEAGDGERSVVGNELFTVLISGDETDGQFGCFVMEGPAGEWVPAHSHDDVHEVFYVMEGELEVRMDDRQGKRVKKVLAPGDFAFVPAGLVHNYHILTPRAKAIGVATGGFERFFHAVGLPTDLRGGIPPEPFFASPDVLREAGSRFRNTHRPDIDLGS
ncbi:quercetin 2,3-dioxygenase [Streptomyces sp. NPDC093252]|uniref:quercetin 2,3-dioxygenase n=1 Tax=Streptomyces sp. NPDC093252 TaxID=3154980 RepID=UPI0034178B1E